MNTCCGYSLEALPQGSSNEYPHIFLWRNKKNINTFGLEKASYQEQCLDAKMKIPYEYSLFLNCNL